MLLYAFNKNSPKLEHQVQLKGNYIVYFYRIINSILFNNLT